MNWLNFFSLKQPQQEKSTKDLENKIDHLTEKIEELKQKQSVIVEQINVDKIIIEKYEQSNNFGQLGIKQLEGKLNIGATYSYDKDELKKSEKEEQPKEQANQKQSKGKKQTNPKVRMRSRK
ncbi:hypothetical protein LC087_04030 [Bacillus carboniphilus]|uniref:Uncharacterized protein n=1 Tax=Bacillus carboniphilus TaxID=86663 RepID=A0ABY9JVC6_9BACI|nr:hypothetical protein [Bacillus carboniphilus]WLR43361.1 hypothetical protein LC087_04030 [Bacillus carboniphilus]